MAEKADWGTPFSTTGFDFEGHAGDDDGEYEDEFDAEADEDEDDFGELEDCIEDPVEMNMLIVVTLKNKS